MKCQVYFGSLKPKTLEILLEFLQFFFLCRQVLIKIIDTVLSYIPAYISNISGKKKVVEFSRTYWPNISITICPLRGLFVWNSGSSLHVSKCKVYLELKWLVIQLLQRRQMWNDRLWRFNTTDFIWSQFILNRRNGIKRGKLYFMLFSGGDLPRQPPSSNIVESTAFSSILISRVVVTINKAIWKFTYSKWLNWLPNGHLTAI